jgi:hypothetical protein
MGRSMLRPYKGEKKEESLFELFGHNGELKLGLGEGLHDDSFGAFGGGVSRGGHFADQEVLCALEHFLFAERERFAAAEGNETLEDDGDFEEGAGAHALGIFLEAMLPVVVRVQFAFFEEAKDFGGFRGADNGTKANGFRVRLRNHDAQAAGNDANHEVTFGSTIQNAVTDLFNQSNTVVRVYDLVTNFVVHGFGCPLRYLQILVECVGRVKIYPVESWS